MKRSWLYLAVGFFVGYLASGLYPSDYTLRRHPADGNEQACRDDNGRKSQASNDAAGWRWADKSPFSGTAARGGTETDIDTMQIDTEEDARLAADEEAVVSEEDAALEAEAISAEIERLEREHSAEDDSQTMFDQRTEMSEAEAEDLRLDLELEIEDETAEVEFKEDNPGWDQADPLAWDGSPGLITESDAEAHRLAMEEAIADEMADLEED
jgi:hypothetical protein